jgi:inosose dehydratase
MVRIGNAPVSYGAFEVTVGHDVDVPTAVEVLDAVESAGYEGIDLGPLGYLGLGDELRTALGSRSLLLTGGYVEVDVSSDEAPGAGLGEVDRVCDQFDSVAEGVEPIFLPRPTVALVVLPRGKTSYSRAREDQVQNRKYPRDRGW